MERKKPFKGKKKVFYILTADIIEQVDGPSYKMILRKEKAHDMDVNSVQWGPGVSFSVRECQIMFIILIRKSYTYFGLMCFKANLAHGNVTHDSINCSLLPFLLLCVCSLYFIRTRPSFTWIGFSLSSVGYNLSCH